MTIKQRLLKLIYPLVMWWRNRADKEYNVLVNKTKTPNIPFYSLSDTSITGQPFSFADLKGKKVLLVNTASNCGYTGQYDELEKLNRKYKDRLVILGFPANDFKEQEKGTDEEIARFCKVNFAVSFPMMHKSTVIKGEDQNSVFKWLTDPEQNGWNKRRPIWNFSKYLVDEKGMLTHYFGPAVSPLSKQVTRVIEDKQ